MTDSAQSPSTYKIGVLICDDADSLRQLLRIVVGLDPGLHVAGEARNGQEAIAEAARLQPDVILLDLSMPVLAGLDALPAIKAAAPGAHVIAFTGLSASVAEEAVRRAGADSFLEKGARPDAIAEAIKHAFAAGRNGDGRNGDGNRPSLASVDLEVG
jgi:NarL family two-component system response regulator LiaR